MIKKLSHLNARGKDRLRAIIGYVAIRVPPAAWRRIGVGAVAAVFLTQVALVAFHQGGLHQRQLAVDAVQEALATHELTLEQLRQESRNQTDAMSAQVARLQAQVLSLNALGEVLTEVAQLEEKTEFQFGSEPALGGQADLAQASLKPAELLASVDTLYRQVEDQSVQLKILTELLQYRRLASEAYPSNWPVRGGWISSYFGMRKDPFTGRRAHHKGVDFGARHGGKIYAAATGIVEFSGRRNQYGLMVEINHGGGYRTRYAHASKLLVDVGETVQRGALIALVGSTGRSTGPHLHFEVLKNGHRVNPLNFLSARR